MSLQWVNIHGSSRYWNAGLWRSFLLKWALWRPLPLTAVHSALGVPPELPGVPCGVWHPAVKPTDFPTGLLGPHRGCTISVHPIPVTAHSPVATCHLGACYELNWSEVLVTQSCLTLCDHQALLYTAFSRREYWSGLPFPSTGDLAKPGMEHGFPTLQADSAHWATRGSHHELNCAPFRILMLKS